MPALTGRRSTDAREESWLVFFGDVHVGTIGIRSGIPHDEDPWGWSWGFYPDSEPGQFLTGTAIDLDQARAGFEERCKNHPYKPWKSEHARGRGDRPALRMIQYRCRAVASTGPVGAIDGYE